MTRFISLVLVVLTGCSKSTETAKQSEPPKQIDLEQRLKASTRRFKPLEVQKSPQEKPKRNMDDVMREAQERRARDLKLMKERNEKTRKMLEQLWEDYKRRWHEEHPEKGHGPEEQSPGSFLFDFWLICGIMQENN